MAKAIKVPSDYKVMLELSMKEAQTLLFVSLHVGGSDQLSPRKHIQEIGEALCEAGVDGDMLNYPLKDSRNSIYFLDSRDPSLL